MRKLVMMIMGVFLPLNLWADVVFSNKTDLMVSIPNNESEVVHTALDMFRGDYKKVFGRNIVSLDKNASVLIGTIGNNSLAEKRLGDEVVSELRLHKEGFVLKVKGNQLYILGSDKRGTAYGILELSRLIGVSPWEWWADSFVGKKNIITLNEGFSKMEYPSVTHRGIFINDEDWGLMPWSCQNYEPSERKGEIGPKTHARIFELLLRLRANTFWPAMHKCSVAFYLIPGNKEVADKYGIFVGTSHCEPMVRNTNAEWNTSENGIYDYVNNRKNVLKFWEERVKELAGSDNIYTLGIRGVHDSRMLGAKTIQEQKVALTNVLKDQREMIARYVNPDVEKVSQVFIPYKEVLDVYHRGLEIPEDVSLLWCDDNYGYIRHFPDAGERARKGGNGVYYHVSYWGRPHDYLWLATNHPAQLYTQMKRAYDKGAKNMWILNVGDIKPGEYLMELFLDMAWKIDGIENSEKGLERHLLSWLSREFGEQNAKELLPVMNEYYRLAYIRKPEFMGNTRTEEKNPVYKNVSDLPWSEAEINQRIEEYTKISDKVVQLSRNIPVEKLPTWFQLVEYPVRAAAEMNRKHLYGQLARHGLTGWERSDTAYDAIVSLTNTYNALNNGKWKKIMNYQPRKLAVFGRIPRVKAETSLLEPENPLFIFNGKDYKRYKGEQPLMHGLGYQRGAISLAKGSSVTYNLKTSKNTPDSIRVVVALAPNHPVEGFKLRYSIALNGEPAKVVDYRTVGRSEEWKQNVLTNQAIRETVHKVSDNKNLSLTITALDKGVVLDQIKIYGVRQR